MHSIASKMLRAQCVSMHFANPAIVRWLVIVFVCSVSIVIPIRNVDSLFAQRKLQIFFSLNVFPFDSSPVYVTALRYILSRTLFVAGLNHYPSHPSVVRICTRTSPFYLGVGLAPRALILAFCLCMLLAMQLIRATPLRLHSGHGRHCIT